MLGEYFIMYIILRVNSATRGEGLGVIPPISVSALVGSLGDFDPFFLFNLA